MKKREIVAILLLLFAVSLSVLGVLVTRNISESILSVVDETEKCILEQDKGGAYATAERLNDNWDSQYKILSSFIPHQHLERCELAITAVKEYVKQNNCTAALLACSEIRVSAEHIYISERPALWNIF